jgi:hypothetical protein
VACALLEWLERGGAGGRAGLAGRGSLFDHGAPSVEADFRTLRDLICADGPCPVPLTGRQMAKAFALVQGNTQGLLTVQGALLDRWE